MVITKLPFLTLASQGATVKTLQSALSAFGLGIPAAETQAELYGVGTTQAVTQFQVGMNLPVTGNVDAITQAMITNLAGLINANKSYIAGVLVMDYGIPANQVEMRLYSVGYGGAATKLADTKTDANGVYSLAYAPPATGANLQVKAVDPKGNEVTISATQYNALSKLNLNLVAPASVQPLTSEYQRLAASIQSAIGGKGIANLNGAQENTTRQDLTLLAQTTGWDPRLVAFAATAATLSQTLNFGVDALYALFRAGLPTDPNQLALVSTDSVLGALEAAQKAGIITWNAQDITNTVNAFTQMARTVRLKMQTIGGVSLYGDLLNASGITDAGQVNAFIDLVFSQPLPADNFWQQATNLKIPAQQLNALQIQGKCFNLTMNNLPLSQVIMKGVNASADFSLLAQQDYYDPATWKGVLNGLANNDANKLATLLPTGYTGGAAVALEGYAADMARKVRVSYPTQTVARMVEKNLIPLGASGAPVSAFLKSAAAMGYQLGQTPLNNFLKANSAKLPPLGTADTAQLKTLHRLYQLTPSNDSLVAVQSLGFTSAQDIVKNTYAAFMAKYAGSFPSRGEADLVYRKAQQVYSVVFNVYTMGKQLDSYVSMFATASSAQAVQNAKAALGQQFPSMQNLFGNMDFCECDDCQSVLSPAAYFVDMLQFLNKPAAVVNASNFCPLEVLIGSVPAAAPALSGRRPDLAALPLTCENTNTSLPYIDIVNEILEYFVSNGALDGGVAYDTGSVSSDDLRAEPQHILPAAYVQLLLSNPQFGYPSGIPFDLWLETVRGFYAYFTILLVRVLEAMKPTPQLELFTDAQNYPYYRYSIFLEQLGLYPNDNSIFTNQNPMAGWFWLYGYPDDNTGMNGGGTFQPLSIAKTLSQYLGVTYKVLTRLVTTGFLNPGLASISFQFQRFGIDMTKAFQYTGQAGYPALSAAEKTSFEANLTRVTQYYKALNAASTFDCKTWLTQTLTAALVGTILVLDNTGNGCDFGSTNLIYANGARATQLDFLKFNLFVRLWNKTGWKIEEVDRALQLFFATGPAGLPVSSNPAFGKAFSSAWQTALVYLSHLGTLAAEWTDPVRKTELLPLWSNLNTTGNNPLYAQIFLRPGVLNIDPDFDDPNGKFPGTPTDLLSGHQAGIQGALGLSASDVSLILADAGASVDTTPVVVNGQNVATPLFSLNNLSLLYRYRLLATQLDLDMVDFVALKSMAVNPTTLQGLNPFTPPTGAPLQQLSDDLLYNQALQFIQEANQVAASGFSMVDLRYLFMHQFDPVGPYRSDDNAVLTLAQTLASGLFQIQSAYAVPTDLTGMSDDLVQQRLANLFPTAQLNALVALLSNQAVFTVSIPGVLAPGSIDPTKFTAFPQINLSYDATTGIQTLHYQGALLPPMVTQLESINTGVLFAQLMTGVQQSMKSTFDAMVNNLLGVWASLVTYEATTQTAPAFALTGPSTDPAFAIGYDPINTVQWVTYRGVMIPKAFSTLTALNPAPAFASLVGNLQQQVLPAFNELMGYLLGLWANSITYQAILTGIPQVDPSLFSAYPQIQLSYNAATSAQTLTYQGVPTTALLAALAPIMPAAGAPLLANVRTQASNFFQSLAQGWISPSPPITTWDTLLDSSVAPYQGTDASKMIKSCKGELIKIFSPLLVQNLSAKSIAQLLSTNASSDLSLTVALLTQTGILADPGYPGHFLQDAFLVLGQQGVSASYYASTDESGPALVSAGITAAGADVSDPSNTSGVHSTGSAHFEGYLQVPTDGPYRFFAELAQAGAKVVFEIDAPVSVSLINNPVLQYTAVTASDETSQFVTLQGGVAYHFSLDFTNLGGAGASLLVQGETLPKGSLDQLVLYPEAAIERFETAWMLLNKALKLIDGLNLDEAEIAYFSANPGQFGGFRLGSLPTQTLSGPRVLALFNQFLILADYADLKNGPAGNTDGLLSVFQAVGQTFTEVPNSGSSNQDQDTPWTKLGNLTRRDPQVIRDVATQLGLFTQQIVAVCGVNQLQMQAQGDFANNKGIRRIWEALQLVQAVGLPVASIVESTLIVSPGKLPANTGQTDSRAGIAGDLRNAVRALYGDDAWRPVAQFVFDPLRQKKRDALVAFIIQKLQLADANALFEYFLVDPGMEPVVQTSRLRLALSSVQTFIQRCLLNLENDKQDVTQNIAPSALNADTWAWMKRYRLWQANREIFLYPENWMEPELRTDATDLFQTLKGTLLKGDITNDLVEGALYAYLQGLDQRARLEIVSTYLEKTTTPLASGSNDITSNSTLHVLGRTYGHPHQYFYRTYSGGIWSEWITVTASIEGDHVALAVWRNRVYLFWATFAVVAAQTKGTLDGSSGTTTMGSITIGALTTGINDVTPQYNAQVQLNYSEYFQGTWNARVSSDTNQYNGVPVGADFDSSTVFIHVTVGAADSFGVDGPMYINLDFTVPAKAQKTVTFYVAGKNTSPDFGTKYAQPILYNPYGSIGVNSTQFVGQPGLTSELVYQLTTSAGLQEVNHNSPILSSSADFSILLCDNPVSPALIPPNLTNLPYSPGAELAPFFFKDDYQKNTATTQANPNTNTFFVEPTPADTSVVAWNGWSIGIPPNIIIPHPIIINQVPVGDLVPVPIGDPAKTAAIYEVNVPTDWATNPSTIVQFGATEIGARGSILPSIQNTAVKTNI